MAKKKFYAVKKGISPGIYDNWPAAESQVKGYPGARYKGFVTKQEAQDWLQDDTLPRKRPKKSPQKRSYVETKTAEDADFIIYTDGGAINNPGPGGYGVVLVAEGAHKELSGGYRLTTNNRMELTACIMALRAVEDRTQKIALFSDSSYVVNGIAKGWVKKWMKNGWLKSDKKPVMNRDLWEELLLLIDGLDIRFRWVKGHAGNPLNERCDELAVKAARGNGLPPDDVYEAAK